MVLPVLESTAAAQNMAKLRWRSELKVPLRAGLAAGAGPGAAWSAWAPAGGPSVGVPAVGVRAVGAPGAGPSWVVSGDPAGGTGVPPWERSVRAGAPTPGSSGLALRIV